MDSNDKPPHRHWHAVCAARSKNHFGARLDTASSDRADLYQSLLRDSELAASCLLQ